MSSNLTGKRQAGNSARQILPGAGQRRIRASRRASVGSRPVRRRGLRQKKRIGASSIFTTPDQCSAPWVVCGGCGVLPGHAAAATDSSIHDRSWLRRTP